MIVGVMPACNNSDLVCYRARSADSGSRIRTPRNVLTQQLTPSGWFGSREFRADTRVAVLLAGTAQTARDEARGRTRTIFEMFPLRGLCREQA